VPIVSVEEIAVVAHQMYARRLAQVERLTVELTAATTPEEAAAVRAMVREMEADLARLDASVVNLERYAVITRIGH
jgi:hypothetical protein